MEKENKLGVAEKHRSAIKQFMSNRGLKPFPWTKKAGLPESTLRNFLNGTTDSISSMTLHELAQAEGINISVLLGAEDNSKKDPLNIPLITQIIETVSDQELAGKKKLDKDIRLQAISHLYEIAIIDENIDLNKEAARLFSFIKKKENQ